ncbi:hypothetical protein F991_02728 [Acinetobacter sp. CIP-A165]|uniref:hypothetical protein n=1 Tax=Acinetobacter sp. CIP-A165 TaxID=40373 RepID=UPI0002CFEA2E|nr:hypothetical protein [Acinetobacter sp. CIP-A165]ENU29339.1 hypothetical protein F991_02728 [Acinetobacter sp. CIP-A165]
MQRVYFNNLLRKQISKTQYEKVVIYRYMDDEIYLDMFCEGKIRLSTLETCRNYENQEKGDIQEGQETYSITHMTDNDPNWRYKAKKAGLSIGEFSGYCTFTNCSSTKKLPDGFLLCTTARRDDDKFSKDFGRFCVKIKDADLFYRLITDEIRKQCDLYCGSHKKVIYRDQNYKDDELPPGKIGFVKRQKYSWQEEYRFLWLPKNFGHCEIIDINIPAIKDLCERVV